MEPAASVEMVLQDLQSLEVILRGMGGFARDYPVAAILLGTVFSIPSIYNLAKTMSALEMNKIEMVSSAALEDIGERASKDWEEDDEEEEEEIREMTPAASQQVAQAMFEVLDLLETNKEMASASKEGAEALLRQVLELLEHKKETVPASKEAAEALHRQLLALLEQEKQVMPPSTEEVEAMFKEAVEVLKLLPERILGLLKPGVHVHGRVGTTITTTTDAELQLLAFIQSELSAFVTWKTWASANCEHGVRSIHLVKWLRSRENMIAWLDDLKVLAQLTEHLVIQHEQAGHDPLPHAWLPKALRWLLFPRANNPRSSSYKGRRITLHAAKALYDAADGPWRYKQEEDGTRTAEANEKVVDSFHFVGMDVPKKKLLGWLTAADDSLRVVSVVGPAGVGKTALASQVFAEARHRFECCAELRIGQRFDTSGIYSKIYNQIEGKTEGFYLANFYTLNRKYIDIWKRLHRKRYLILIDDLWKASDWEEIKFFLPKNLCGSRILITTRIGHVARWCCSAYDGLVYEMKALDVLYSSRLLHTYAFGARDSSPKGNLKLFCDEILQKSEGIPLFLTGMADYLLRQEHEAKRKHFTVDNTQLPEQLARKLCSAYDELPYGLRLFLLSLCMFPPGHKFNKDDLIMKWIYERRATKEEAEWFFSQLVDKNVITRVPANCRDDPYNDTCYWKLHQFMWLFLASKAANIGFLYTTTTLASEAGPSKGGGNKTWTPRHLSLHHPDSKLQIVLQEMDLSQTRSLAVSGAMDQIPLDKFTGLVVLDLKGWKKLNDVHLLKLCSGKMFLLAYLSLSNTGIRKIPPQIKELLRLRALDISHTEISELPPEVFELELLSMLNLRSTLIGELPKQIVLSKNLQDLLIGGNETAIKLPQQIGDVRSIEKMETVNLSECPAMLVEALGNLDRLRELAMTWSSHQCTRSYSSALLDSIQKWRDLESLVMHCGLGCSIEFLGSISKPPKRLQKFKVTGGRFVRVPQWLKGLKHLAFLQITLCKLSPDDIKMLGNLLRLQCLILGLEFILKEEVVIESEGFPVLTRFVVDCPVPWLTFKTGAMPKVTHLHLKFGSGPASHQGSVPSGVRNLRSLIEVALSYNQKWCAGSTGVKMTVDAVKKEVTKHQKPIDLVINDTIVSVEEDEEVTDSATAIRRCDVQAPVVQEGAVRAATEICSEVEAHEDRNDGDDHPGSSIAESSVHCRFSSAG